MGRGGGSIKKIHTAKTAGKKSWKGNHWEIIEQVLSTIISLVFDVQKIMDNLKWRRKITPQKIAQPLFPPPQTSNDPSLR